MLRSAVSVLFAVPLLTLGAPAPKDGLALCGKPVDPAKDCKFVVKDGKLTITVPDGKEPYDLSAEAKGDVPVKK